MGRKNGRKQLSVSCHQPFANSADLSTLSSDSGGK